MGLQPKPRERIQRLHFLLLVLVGCVLGGAASLVGVVAVEKTSGVEFCASCHTMTPMVQAYREDLHGGNNRSGLLAECSDCHLPHDNVLHYLFQKGLTGTKDVLVETFGRPEHIDWEERRKRREVFTYDSGCLKCHHNLQTATMADPKAFIAHKAYFMGATDKTCVSCHEHVGHKHLGLFLRRDEEEAK